MRLLADESCDFSVVRALRQAGHDVTAVVESHRGAGDEDVIALAVSEQRILLTEDKDFGQLVHAAAGQVGGVVFIRFPARARRGLPATMVELFAKHGERLAGGFAVVQPGRVRISRRRWS
jgi:predicted nuclease of predicted toxin-antitoxin system